MRSRVGSPWWSLLVVLLLVCLAAPVAADSTGERTQGVYETSGDAGLTLTTAPNNSTGPITAEVHPDERVTTVVVTLDGGPDLPDGATDDELDTYRSAVERHQSSTVEHLDDLENVTVERTFWITNAVVVTVRQNVTESLLGMAAAPNVEAIHDNHNITLDRSESFPSSTSEVGSGASSPFVPSRAGANAIDATGVETTYGLSMIDAPTVWDTQTRGNGSRIAVLDTGVDIGHSDIDLRTTDPDDPTYPGGWVEYRLDGTEVDGSEPFDSHGHGTHVSGTVVGGNTSGTTIGVAPDAELLHGLVFPDGESSFAAIVAGMEWAIENDADAVSLSLGAVTDGSSVYLSDFIDPIDNTRAAGTAVIASSGNAGENITTSPGNVYSAISAGAVDENQAVRGFSSGETVDTGKAWGDDAPADWPETYVVPTVTAPGSGVISAEAGTTDGFVSRSGTSMAAPHVAGAVGLLRSERPDLSVSEVESLLRSTAVHPTGYTTTPDNRYGAGIINVQNAMIAAEHDTWIFGTAVVGSEPAATVRLDTDSRTRAVTAENGSFAVPVAPGERKITIETERFGPVTESVEATAGERTEVTLDFDRTLTADLVTDQPETMTAGESTTVTFEVEHLTGYSVRTDETSEIGDEEVTIAVDGSPIEPGERLSFDDYSGRVDINITTAESAAGDLVVTHTLQGINDEERIITGPTTVSAPDTDELRVTDVRVPGQIPASSMPTIEFVVTNTGDEPVTSDIEWSDDGDSPLRIGDSVQLDPGESTVVRERLDHAFSPGTVAHTVALVDPVTDERRVAATATTEMLDSDGGLEISAVNGSTVIGNDEPVVTELTVRNAGEAEIDDLVWGELDDSIYATDRVTLLPDENATIILQRFDAERGGFTHRSGTSTDQISRPVYVDFDRYVREDGTVGARNLGNGAADFRAGTVSARFLGDLASAFRSGSQLRVR